MEFLIKTTIAVVFLLSFQTAKSQEFNTLLSAFEKSYTYEKQNEFNRAIEELKGVYSDDSYEISLRLGWLNYLQGNFTESASHYRHAVELKPYSEEAKMGLVLPLSATGKWDEVVDLYNKILENNPKNTKVNYRLGLIYYNRKQYDKAFPYFKTVVDLYPFDYDGLLMLAWTHFSLGQTREAKVLFQKCLLFKPGDQSASDGLSRIP